LLFVFISFSVFLCKITDKALGKLKPIPLRLTYIYLPRRNANSPKLALIRNSGRAGAISVFVLAIVGWLAWLNAPRGMAM
jgi:hypothetical protein